MQKKETTLKRVRVSKGLTQQELSAATGISIRTIQHWEQGSKDFNQAAAITAYAVAKTLGVDILDLLDIERVEPVAVYERKNPESYILKAPRNEEEEEILKLETERAKELLQRTKEQAAAMRTAITSKTGSSTTLKDAQNRGLGPCSKCH